MNIFTAISNQPYYQNIDRSIHPYPQGYFLQDKRYENRINARYDKIHARKNKIHARYDKIDI